MRVVVYGLWHLGCVTAACLARAGNRVIGLDPDAKVTDNLAMGKPPLQEPGLDELIAEGIAEGSLSFSTDADSALADADVLWVAFDTAVNENDEADVSAVRARIQEVTEAIRPGTLVLISSQVPVGFTRQLMRDLAGRGLQFAYSPENLRLGKAIHVFRNPERVILGVDADCDRGRINRLFAPFCQNLLWMSLESAEMTKHALNAFLGTSVAFANELARLCEVVGADAKEVERGLKSEGRIGPKAYLSPGAAFAGGTLARDLHFLVEHGAQRKVRTPLLRGVLSSNDVHKRWTRSRVARELQDIDGPTVAVLGLTYKPGTNTLRRSSAVELARWLHSRGVRVQAHDPAVTELPPRLDVAIELMPDPLRALDGADVAVIATEWPHYRMLTAADFATRMRRPVVIDPSHFLGTELAAEPSIRYIATGKCTAPVLSLSPMED